MAGTTITASWSNSNNRDQVITPFASASARDSAITSPIEGQYAHLNDTNKLTHYNGSAWVPTANNIVGTPFISTASPSTYSTGATTDMVVSGIPARADRNYTVTGHSRLEQVSGPADWIVNLFEDGTQVAELYAWGGAGEFRGTMASTVLWQPATGTKSLDIRVSRISGTGTLSFIGAVGTPRQLWVEDIGPR